MEHQGFKAISGLLVQPSRILVISHTNPDGDAIGACLALYGYLGKKGHTVSAMIPDPDPEFLHWMPYHEHLLIFTENKDECLEKIRTADIIFCVDFSGLKRLSGAAEPVRSAPGIKVLIDHHLDPDPEFDHRISVTETSSTSELIYDFIVDSGDKSLIDKDIAACIYTGIVTDTGSFSYSCDYRKSYEVTAELIGTGISGELIHRLVYDTYSEQRLRLLGYSLSEKLVVLPEFHTAYISLTLEELNRFSHRIGDTEGVVNYALSVRDVNFAGLFYEREDGIVKVSLRSKGNFAVHGIAREYFGGGGHANAAGANSRLSLEETIRTFREILPLFRDKLKSVY